MSGLSEKCNFLIKGPPGIGKTTLVCKVVELLKKENIPLKGFITLEKRNANHQRVGFDLKSVTDESVVPLARVENDSNSKFRVGKYVVYPDNLEKFALPLINDYRDSRGVIIIDEIGKMESFSKSLFNQIENLFKNRNNVIIATCNAVGKPLPLVTNLLKNPTINVIEILSEAVLRPAITEQELETARDAVQFEIESLNMRPEQEPLLIHAVSHSNRSGLDTKIFQHLIEYLK